MPKHNLPITDIKSEQSTKPEVQTKAAVIELHNLQIPFGPLPGYIVRRVDIHRMSAIQSERLAKIVSGLQHEQAKLQNGTVVRNGMHAIQWMLENA